MPRVVSFIVLVAILAFIASMFFKVMAQFVLPLFLAAVLVVVFKPLHEWIREQIPGRLRLSAIITTFLIMLVVLLPTAWLGWHAYLEGRLVFDYLKNRENRAVLEKKLTDAARSVTDVFPFLDIYEKPVTDPAAGSLLPTNPVNPETAKTAATPPSVPEPPADDVDGEGEEEPSEISVFEPAIDTDGGKTSETAEPNLRLRVEALYDVAAGAVGGLLIAMAQGLLGVTLGLIIMVLAIYYFLVDGPTMINTMMRLSPLDNEYERELLDKFANVSRGVVVAVLAAAVVQGLLAGIGFYFALSPGAPIALLMAITMVASVIPFVGAAGIWIPTCLWIFFYQGERLIDGQIVTGEPMTAILLALYCGGVVSTIDNVIKPLVLHGQSNLHPLLALMSVLGGVKALGPVGILIGPMLVAFVHALLVIVNKELRLLSSDVVDGQYQKTMFAGDGGGSIEGEPGTEATPALVPPKPVSRLERVRNAAKRRRKKK